MKRAILGIALLLVPVAGHADEASRTEKVERILELTKMDEMVDTMYAQMEQAWRGMAERSAAEAGSKEFVDRNMEGMLEIFRETMNVEKLEAMMVEVYVKHYTDEELADMVAFYESDTGRSMIAKAPAVMAEFMTKSQTIAMESLPKVRALTEKLIAEGARREPAEDED